MRKTLLDKSANIVVLANENEALSKAKTTRKNVVKGAPPDTGSGTNPNPNPNPKVTEEIGILQKQYELVVLILSAIPSLGANEQGLSFFEEGQICKVLKMNLSPLTFDYLARYLRGRDVLLPMSVFLHTTRTRSVGARCWQRAGICRHLFHFTSWRGKGD